MESSNYESFITSTVEAMFPRFTYRKVCFVMRIRMDWDYYPEEENPQYHQKRKFHKEFLLVFHRPSNYTKVLFKDITGMHPFLHDNGEEIEMDELSDHDSCWRSDGMRWVFKTFVEAWDYFDKFGIEGRGISPMFGYALLGNPYHHHLEMLEKTDPFDDRCFTYKVKIGKKIQMHEISKYMNDPDDPEKLFRLEQQEETNFAKLHKGLES